MPSSELPEFRSEAEPDAISEGAQDWLREFMKRFELSFIDICRHVPSDASWSKYRDVTVRAMFETLLDSGADAESIASIVGEVMIERRLTSVQWTPDLNQRRFELIDKDIQETLTLAEQIELAGLTGIMRQQLDSEVNLPLEGAKALHRKLLELK